MSHAHRFVFLKTRKTAGTSIEMALEPLCRPAGAKVTERTPALESGQGVVGRRLSPLSTAARAALPVDWRNHMPAAEVRSALGDARWRRYLRITAVRDPFDAAVSRFHWEHARRGEPESNDFGEIRRQFRAMVTSSDYPNDADLVHIDGAFVADRAIRFERIDADFAAVMREIAPARPAPELAHAKRTSGRRRRAVAEYYDAASVAAVRAAAAWAFDRFGYPDSPAEGAGAPLLEVNDD